MAGGQLTWSLVSESAGFGNLLSDQVRIWFGDFTGAGRTQVMFYYAGDGNWWLGDMAGGQLTWSFRGNTGRPCSQFLMVHFKTLVALSTAISGFIDQQFLDMHELFSTVGIAAYRGTTEDLSGNANLATLANLNVGACLRGQPTADQTTLFANRNNAGADDLVVYVVTQVELVVSMWSPGLDYQACGGEAAVDQVRPVLDLLQLALDDGASRVPCTPGSV